MAFTFKTNNVPRDLFRGYELTDKERAEFDYYAPEELDDALFFRYKGQLHDLGEFYCCPDVLKPWHGYFSYTFSSGIVVKYVSYSEQVIVGMYYS